MYAGEPLYPCKTEVTSLFPPPSYSPLPSSLLPPEILYSPHLYHQQQLDLSGQGLFSSYQYYQVTAVIFVYKQLYDSELVSVPVQRGNSFFPQPETKFLVSEWGI
jgi:hypothetical protein